jgi:hypothetical protein
MWDEKFFENVHNLNNIAAPICLVVCSIGFPVMLWAAFTTHEHVPWYLYLEGVGGPAAGLALSFWYCRTRMGWFQRKPK